MHKRIHGEQWIESQHMIAKNESEEVPPSIPLLKHIRIQNREMFYLPANLKEHRSLRILADLGSLIHFSSPSLRSVVTLLSKYVEI